MTNYTIRAERFLKAIYPIIKDHLTEPYECRHAMTMYGIRHHRRISVGFGVSRIAIITADYVIKFDYDFDEVRSVGGCESELDFYAFACERGFGYLFAEITPYEYEGHTFYFMPRVSGIQRHKYRYANEFFSGEEAEFIEDYLHDLHDENYGWHNNKPIIFDYACNELWLQFIHEREGVSES